MKAYLMKKFKEISPALIFLVVYLTAFALLENWHHSFYLVTDCKLDHMIPFLPVFIIPYLLWFVYIFGGFAFLLFKEPGSLKKAYFNLFVGMSICLLIYTLLPSKQMLRVSIDSSHIFQRIIGYIYSVDSNTNVCPSIHVYNSIMMTLVLHETDYFKEHPWLDGCSIILSILICLSTVFVKQHAIIDVVCAIILVIIIRFIGKKYLKL